MSHLLKTARHRHLSRNCRIIRIKLRFQKGFYPIVLIYYVAGDIIPFFTDYPLVTHMDRPDADGVPAAMSIEETFFIKYILKPQPLSTGKYLLTVKPGENFKVCKLVVTHIGQNFPCAQISDDMPVEDRSTTWGYAGTDFAKNTDVVLSFSVSF